MAPRDAAAADLAATQHGLLTYRQALAIGFSPNAVQTRATQGRWVRVGRGVYRVGGAPLTWQQRAMAAHLGGPAGNVTSHLTSAALAGLDVAPPPVPHLTVLRGRSTRWPGAVVHSARLPLADVTVPQGIPATAVRCTLIDCAAVLGPNRLQRLVDEAVHRRLVDLDRLPELWDLARRGAGRAGEVRLRAAVEPWAGPIRPGSPAEVRLRRQVVE
ncbi:MAG: type IV toxin-antitoxin system AbiEi family antitoxin domain-containing protein [Actinobacteria bacterium]|nr:type IV toxin-antitoxin system AbiEi family antitoxin domain-containing protein [Actinomycetota bacterium]